MAHRWTGLRLIHLVFVIAALAVAFVVMLPSAAAIYAGSTTVLCIVVGLGRASVAEMYVLMAVLFPIHWLLSEGVRHASGLP